MDRGMSRSTSTPYIPRYQSLSPGRSPQLGGRRFTSLRSISQPSQRIYYIGNSPARVINSYHVHHSPSPNKTYKIHLCSSKTNHYLTRVTRSQSAYDINSSHMYTSQEDISYKPFKEAATRRAGSCEDIYHKAPFFPDVTQSESGVSFGESEEGSAFGGEDDNVSQHSFDSSSAFYEVTVDSELDKCDSDNFSGPDCIGDRALGILHENYLDENLDRKQQGQSQSYQDPHSADSSFTSLLSRMESRKRESASRSSWNFDKFQAQTEVLRVIIPDTESSAKTSVDSNKFGGRKVMSSTPLAHSTPHVSPGGPEELQLHATASWNADDPFGDGKGYAEVRKYTTARSVFEPESDVKLLFKLEDSSCASSCSEDNYSDVSNITISSQGSRKTKLVKKHSDKPASAKRNYLSYLPNLPCTIQTESTSSGNSLETCGQHGNVTSGNLSSEDSGCFTSTQSHAETYKDQQIHANIVKYGELISKDGKDWWTAYNMNITTEQEANVESEINDNREKLFSFQRDIRVVKPLTVNIPLISAGKHGQEKLRQLSQTSQSPSRSPPLSLREAAQTLDSGMNESHVADDRNQANIDGQMEPLGRQLCELKQSDHKEYHKYNLRENEEPKEASISTGQTYELSLTAVLASDSTRDGLSGSPLNGEISHSDLCFEFIPQVSEHTCSESEEFGINGVLEDNGSKVAEVDELQFSRSEEDDNKKCKPNSSVSNNFGISSETPDGLNSTDDIILPVDIVCASGAQLQKVNSLVTEQGMDSANVENITEFDINEQPTEPQLWVLTCSDELDSAAESLLETRATSDSAGLPARPAQVLESSIPDGGSCLVRLSNYLDSEASVGKKEIVSEQELSESDVLEENTCVHLDKNIVHENSFGKINFSDSSVREQVQFGVELCSENTSFSDDIDSELLVGTKSYTVDIDDSNIVNFATVNDSLTGCTALKEAEQSQSSRFENCSTVDSGVTAENTDMENLIEPGMRGSRSPSECWETPQVILHVNATAQISEDSIQNTAIPLHRNSGMSHHSLLSLSDLNDNSENADTATVFSELPQTNRQDNVAQQITTSSDVNKQQVHNSVETRYDLKQQETVGTSVCTDIPRPVDESITRQGNVAQRGDKGVNKGEHFCTEKTARFVDRGEEFKYYPSVHEKLVVVTETSRRIEHIHRVTIERIVTKEQRENNSSLDLSRVDDFSRVGVVSDKSVTEKVVKEDEGYTALTTDTLYSHAGKEDTITVSSDKCCLDVDINTTSRLPVSSITITLSEPAAVQGIYRPLQSAASTHYYSSSESTSYLADQIAIPTELYSQNAESDNKDINHVPIDQVAFSYDKVCDKTNVGEILASVEETATADMPRSDHLDNLQAQLSLISNDIFSTQLTASNDSDQYQDHAEATSVLKQIVRGDTTNFTHFSNTSRGSGEDGGFQDCFTACESNVVVTGELTNELEAGVGEWYDVGSCQSREGYDNDYDYVTTDLPRGPKLFSRPHHHPHLSKPGQFKASSLWTLQEETESAMNTMSPRPSPKLPLVTLTSKEDNCSYQLVQSPTSLQSNLVKEKARDVENENKQYNAHLVYGNRVLVSESSDFEESDGNYSSISTPDSDSRRSISSGREQTPLSETELVTMINDDDKTDYVDASKITNISTFPDRQELEDFTTDCANKSHISVPIMEDNQSNTLIEQKGESESHITNFRSNLTFSVSSPESKDDGLSPLDRLCASLEQFTEPSNDGWRLILLAENATTASDSMESDMGTSSDYMAQHSDDDTGSETSWRHNLGLDTSHGSPKPTDASEGMYTSTGRAEIKKTSSFHDDIPSVYTDKSSFSPDFKRKAVERQEYQLHEEKIKQFENLLDEFSKSILPNAVISEFIFLREKRSDLSQSSGSSSEDLYKSFTNDDSERKQNHVCIVVEDENMNTFRFKRYLKKSHTKRKKGKKVLRFLSKLGCVSESLSSPISSPNRRLKQSDEEAQVFSTDTLASSKRTASNPILINSTSFHHRDILNTSPLRYTDECSTPFSSNRSLDSIRSKVDSAYSSISESVAEDLNSPASQCGHSTSFRVPPASSGSVSSVFCSGSTSGEWSFSDNVFSTSVGDSLRTSDSFSKENVAHRTHYPPGCADSDMMSSLSDVFDQLNVCEDEIDNALLNRIRHGHVKAGVDKQ